MKAVYGDAEEDAVACVVQAAAHMLGWGRWSLRALPGLVR